MQIKWEVFTIEERNKIQALIADGHADQIAHAITVDDLEKEIWVNRIVDLHKPVSVVMESKVDAERKEFELKGGRIESPEQEKEWQAKIDAEKAERDALTEKAQKERDEKMEKALNRRKKKLEDEVVEEPKTELDPIVTTTDTEEPKRRGRPPKEDSEA